MDGQSIENAALGHVSGALVQVKGLLACQGYNQRLSPQMQTEELEGGGR